MQQQQHIFVSRKETMKLKEKKKRDQNMKPYFVYLF
jgi:hypothetical protein